MEVVASEKLEAGWQLLPEGHEAPPLSDGDASRDLQLFVDFDADGLINWRSGEYTWALYEEGDDHEEERYEPQIDQNHVTGGHPSQDEAEGAQAEPQGDTGKQSTLPAYDFLGGLYLL